MDVAATINGVSYGLLGIALCVAAFTDITKRIIPNWLTAAIAVIFAAKTIALLLAGDSIYTVLLFPLLGASVIFSVTLFLFARGLLGGGDTKLLSALGLFTPFSLLLPMVWIMAVTGGFVALITLIFARIKNTSQTVPYGVAIMAAGLFVCGVESGLITTQHGAI